MTETNPTNSSNKAETAPIFDITNPKSSLISLNMSNITKLTETNYITWRLQISSLLEAHELHCFIDDTHQAPVEKQVTIGGTAQTDPLVITWKRQDKLLFSSLIGSLSLAIQPIVARATTTLEVWQTLSRTYGKPSRGHIKQIRQQLKHFTKGNKSINEFIRTIIKKTDQLALLGSPMEHEDILDTITDGLGEDYRAIIEMVNGRDSPISIDELHEKLINRENTLTEPSNPSITSPVTANSTQVRSFGQSTNLNRNSNNLRGGSSNYRVGNKGGYRGGYLGKCQICGVQGHSATRCPQFQQITKQYGPPPSPNYRGNTPWSAAPHLPLPTPQWQANHTTASSVDTSPWLLDSGASHHIASDLHNLSLHSPYQGTENVMIGNGAGLPITHTGEGPQHGDNASQRQGQ